MLRILKSRFKEITERGNEFIKKWIERSVKEDGFLLIMVFGDRGLGKSTLALNIVHEALGALYPDRSDEDIWTQTVKHTVFTIEDFFNAPNRSDIWKWEDDRVPILLWDDFAMHTSSYGFMRGEGEKIGEFLEDFEAIREELAVVVVTCATLEMIPPKLREAPQIYVKMVKRGKGKVYVKIDNEEGRTLFDKLLVWKYTITSSRVPEEYYNQYRALKKKAYEIKKKKILIRKKKKAEELAEEIKDWEWEDKLILSGYGIIDSFDNITSFGELVIRAYIDKFGMFPPLPEDIRHNISGIPPDVATENEAKRINLAMLFSEVISQRKFEALLRSCGIRGNKDLLRHAYRELIRYLEEKGDNTIIGVLN